MPAENRERMTQFYTKAFGWKTTMLGEEMGNYVLATTAETDAKGVIKKPGTINGGFFPKTKENAHPSVVVGVENLQESMKHVTAAGGKIIGHPVEIPGHGTYIQFIDTEGNKLSMIQPFKM